MAENADKLHMVLPGDHPEIPWTALLLGIWIPNFFYWGFNQFITHRTLGAKTLAHGPNGILFAAFLKLLIPFIIVFPGIMAFQLYQGQIADGDQAYPVLIQNLLPVGLRGILFAALFGAVMSSLDSMLNSASTMVTMDFIKKLRPEASNKTLVIAGRVVTFVFMTMAILWAPQILKFPDIWTYLQSMLAYLSPPVIACFIMGVFWKRSTRTAAFSALIAGHFAAAVIFVLDVMGVLVVQTGPLAAEQLAAVAAGAPVLHFLYLAPLLLVVSILVIVGVSLSGEKPDPETVRELTWSPAFFREETKELAALPWYKNYRYQTVGMLVLIALFVGMFW